MYVLNSSKSSTTKFMTYEVTFNRKPNRGETKKFTMLDKKQKKVNVEIDGTETEAATSSKPTTSAAAALDTDTDDEYPWLELLIDSVPKRLPTLIGIF